MMDLKEWAEQLYAKGDSETAEHGREILELFDLEDRDEKLAEIEEDLDNCAKRLSIDETEPRRILEKMADKCSLADSAQERLAKYGFNGQDLDVQCKEIARTLSDIKETLRLMGGYEITESTNLDLLVMDLCERAKVKQYDL